MARKTPPVSGNYIDADGNLVNIFGDPVIVATGVQDGTDTFPWSGVVDGAGNIHDPRELFQGGGGGVTVHNNLTGRDAATAHPISAITGLQDALNNAGGVPNYTAGTQYKRWDVFTDSGNKYLWRATQDFTASSFNLDSMAGLFELIGTSIFAYGNGVIYRPNYLFLDPTESYICKVDVPFVGTDFDSDLALGYFHALGILEAPTDGKQYARQNQAWSEIPPAVDVSGKMNIFTISSGAMEEPQYGQYPALYITPQMPQSVLEAANSGTEIHIMFDSVRHYDDGHFNGGFAHIGNEFIFQEGMGWNYTDGFSLAYDDTTGAMTRWSPCSADTHFVAELDAATGYIKITPRDPADILSFSWATGLVYVPSSASETFDGIDLYNKMTAEKLETDIKLSNLEARILALENP